MTDPARVRRHAERIRELVASAVRVQIKDPRLGMITITDARITNDLHDATVYYTVLGDSVAQADTAAALESAKGLLRSTVNKALGLRYAPTLTFVLDDVQEHVKQIDELIAQARDADAQVQRIAVGASTRATRSPTGSTMTTSTSWTTSPTPMSPTPTTLTPMTWRRRRARPTPTGTAGEHGRHYAGTADCCVTHR